MSEYEQRATTVRRMAGLLSAGLVAATLVGAGPAAPVQAQPGPPAKQPVAEGYGGAVSTVDADATRAGIEVLRHGGNAVDAAVAAAATLGVTEPYSAGIGGGGFFVFYDAATGRVRTLDGRETAPAAMGPTAFVDPATGLPIPFAEAVTSGLSVGVPGTPATWDRALREWGTISLGRALRPAIEVARRGFVVDTTFQQQTAANAARFAHFGSTAELFLPGGQPPAVGSVFRNPDLAGDLPAARPARGRLLLPRPARRTDRRDRAAAAGRPPATRTSPAPAWSRRRTWRRTG